MPARSSRGRHFAVWIGLVPEQNGSGGKMALGRISKKGEPYLRGSLCSAPQPLFATCATSPT
nr:transposase [Bradyrhizobium campsiandrae]